MRKALGDFKTVGVTVDIVPVERNLDEMDLHLRARIGKKSYMETIQVKMRDSFETDLEGVLSRASLGVIELIRKESPELFTLREICDGTQE